MKNTLTGNTADELIGLLHQVIGFLQYTKSASADEMQSDDGPAIIDTIDLRLRSDMDDSDHAKDKHSATLTVVLGAGKRPRRNP